MKDGYPFFKIGSKNSQSDSPEVVIVFPCIHVLSGDTIKIKAVVT